MYLFVIWLEKIRRLIPLARIFMNILDGKNEILYALQNRIFVNILDGKNECNLWFCLSQVNSFRKNFCEYLRRIDT